MKSWTRDAVADIGLWMGSLKTLIISGRRCAGLWIEWISRKLRLFMPRKPTRKQKAAATIIMANPGISTAEAMRQAGYSNAMVRNPQDLLKSRTFAELLEEYLPDERLAEVHAAGLDAVKITRDKFGDKYEDPDYYVRHSYLETAYKIKGRLTPPNSDKTGDVVINLAIYGQQNDRHTVQVQPKTIPTTLSGGDGRGLSPSSDSLAPQKR